MKKINYIVYGHTSYLDVLKIQTDYITGRGNVTLFVNSNDLELSDLYAKYDRVIFYDDTVQYAARLIHCLNQIDDDYFLLVHDIDILLNVDDDVILKFYEFMKLHGVDRIDLKHTNNITGDNVVRVGNTPVVEWETLPSNHITEGIFLIPQLNQNDFIYNVNPSIWKRESFLELLNRFPDKTYRTIEGIDVQSFATKFYVYKLHSNENIECGYFICLNIFKFLHISHSSKLLTLNDSFKTAYGQSYAPIGEEYKKIVEKYDLKSSSKWVN